MGNKKTAGLRMKAHSFLRRETKCEESSISLRKAMDREPHLFFLLTDPLFQCTYDLGAGVAGLAVAEASALFLDVLRMSEDGSGSFLPEERFAGVRAGKADQSIDRHDVCFGFFFQGHGGCFFVSGAGCSEPFFCGGFGFGAGRGSGDELLYFFGECISDFFCHENHPFLYLFCIGIFIILGIDKDASTQNFLTRYGE